MHRSCEEGLQQQASKLCRLSHVGQLDFLFDDKPQPWEVHVYRVLEYSGLLVPRRRPADAPFG